MVTESTKMESDPRALDLEGFGKGFIAYEDQLLYSYQSIHVAGHAS
jgi:hypothetical protein